MQNTNPRSLDLVQRIARAAGGAIAIGVMIAAADISHYALYMVPFATSIVLVMGTPEAEPAQPRALIGGHLVSTLVGLLVLKVAGPSEWAAAVSVGLAIGAMQLTRTFHPPAGIDPLLVVINDVSWRFLLAPVGVGVLSLAVFAFCWHSLWRRTICSATSSSPD